MQTITIDINNKQIMSLSQEKHDGEITLFSSGGVFEPPNEWTISQGDFVMLMNYYRTQKQNGKPIF